MNNQPAETNGPFDPWSEFVNNSTEFDINLNTELTGLGMEDETRRIHDKLHDRITKFADDFIAAPELPEDMPISVWVGSECAAKSGFYYSYDHPEDDADITDKPRPIMTAYRMMFLMGFSMAQAMLKGEIDLDGSPEDTDQV